MSLAGSNFARMRASMAIVAGILSATVWSATALGADKVTFLTSWFAQAEHGGFYQAKATGLYEKAGLDVTSRWAARRSTACSFCSPARPTS